MHKALKELVDVHADKMDKLAKELEDVHADKMDKLAKELGDVHNEKMAKVLMELENAEIKNREFNNSVEKLSLKVTFRQITLATGGRLTVCLVSSLIRVDLTKVRKYVAISMQ